MKFLEKAKTAGTENRVVAAWVWEQGLITDRHRVYFKGIKLYI